MALSGHTQELSLTDLIQVKAIARSTCRVTTSGPLGPGVLLLEQGTVVHAAYGDRVGEAAAHALLAEDDVYYQAKNDVPVEHRTMAMPAQELLMETMRLKDEGRIPRVGAAPAKGRPGGVAAQGARGAATPIPAAETVEVDEALHPLGSEPRSPSRSWILAAAVAGLVVLAGIAFVLRPEAGESSDAGRGQTPEAASGAAIPPGPQRDPVEASELTGPRDQLPALLQGAPPENPAPQQGVNPTIICRLLVDTEGRVVEAEVYRPRSGLQVFEEAALETVRHYRFRPAEREGVPVPVRINWPVDFL